MKLSKKRLRILLYSDHFYPSLGGSENYALDLATELSRQGHHVGVVTAEKAFVADSFPFELFRLRKPFSPHRINLNFIEMPRIIRQFRPHVFHINYQTGGENLLIPLLRLMRIPFVITYHADHVVTLGRMLDELQLASTFRLASMIMVQSERDRIKFKMRGIPEYRLKLMRFNGIDTEKYKCVTRAPIGEENIKLLCIARLDDSHRYKGVHELIRSMGECRRHDLPFKLTLTIIGDGNLRVFYEEECKRRHLDHVNFAGDVSFKVLVRQICSSDFLILPSTNKAEGFGRVALEALSCGTPVIVSKYAGIAELIVKYNAGLVYNPFLFESLVENLSNTYKSPHQLQKFVANGRRLLTEEGLSLTETTKYTIKLYNECANKK